MADICSENLFSRSTRSAVRQLDELVHVAAVYLGIAVLVTLGLSVVVPSLREQSRNVHTALLAVLRPDVIQDDAALSFDAGQDELLAGADEQVFESPPSAQPSTPSPSSAAPASAPPVPAPDGAAKPSASPTETKPSTAPNEAKPSAAPNEAKPSAGSDEAKPPSGSTAAKSAGKPGTTQRAAKPAVKDAAKSNPASAANFARAIRASADGLSIPGVTSAQARALRSYIARKYKIAYSVSGVLIKTAFTVASEKKIDPQLLLAVIAIESRYNPYAESHVGAQGLMQVMTKVHKDKFERYGEVAAAALNPVANIRVGAQILDDCIKRRGSLQGGLACYVGATGPSDGGYGAKVLAERRRIALASGIPIGND